MCACVCVCMLFELDVVTAADGMDDGDVAAASASTYNFTTMLML